MQRTGELMESGRTQLADGETAQVNLLVTQYLSGFGEVCLPYMGHIKNTINPSSGIIFVSGGIQLETIRVRFLIISYFRAIGYLALSYPIAGIRP